MRISQAIHALTRISAARGDIELAHFSDQGVGGRDTFLPIESIAVQERSALAPGVDVEVHGDAFIVLR